MHVILEVRTCMERTTDNIFIDLMPESEKKIFLNARKVKDWKYNPEEARQGLAKLLTGTFTTEDGLTLSPKEIIDMKTAGYVMANPTPQNTKALYELAGLAAPKEIDVTSGGKNIDDILHSLSIKKPDGEN